MRTKTKQERFEDYLEVCRLATLLGANDRYKKRKTKRTSEKVWSSVRLHIGLRNIAMPPRTLSTRRALMKAYNAGWECWLSDQINIQKLNEL